MKEERLRELSLFSLKKRRLWEDPTIICSYQGEDAEKMEPGSPQTCLMTEQGAMNITMDRGNSH